MLNRHMSTKTIPTVYQSSKTVKRQSSSKKWPFVYQSSHVFTESAEYTKPRKHRYLARPPSHVPGQWPQPVARGQGWLCVSTWTSMRLAPVRCRVLLHSLLPTDDACSSSIVCQRPSSNFPYFRTPLANFLLSRPNSVEYGNSKTTTLLSASTLSRSNWCGERPSGWHDIVTCQRLVCFCFCFYCFYHLPFYW